MNDLTNISGTKDIHSRIMEVCRGTRVNNFVESHDVSLSRKFTRLTL